MQHEQPSSEAAEHPVDEAARVLGGREALAKAFNKSLSAIGQWKVRGVPIEHCARLERLVPTVTRQRLRPDDFAEIWPELAGDATPAAAAVDSPVIGERAHG